MLLAESGPKNLLYPHIQEQFTGLMRVGLADAQPDEIDWNKIVENWDLPFPHKIKPSGMNPCSQKELDAIKAGEYPGLGSSGRPTLHELAHKAEITSFEELNELSPSLGDDFKRCLAKLAKGKQKQPSLFEI